jgi:hypothetical protein
MYIDVLDAFIYSLSLREAAIVATISAYECGKSDLQRSDVAQLESGTVCSDDPPRPGSSMVGVWKPFRDMVTTDLSGRLLQECGKVGKALCASIDTGALKTDHIIRTLDGLIHPDETFIDLDDLRQWLEERGIPITDVVEGYIDEEAAVLIKLEDTLSTIRLAQDAGIDWQSRQREGLSDDALLELYALRAENHSLRGILENANVERPRSGSAQGNLLRLIAIMNVELFGPQAQHYYKAASVLEVAGQKLGVTLSDETIAKRLREAMEFIEGTKLSPK